MDESSQLSRSSSSDLPSPVVSSDTYDDEYFRHVCLGSDEWSRSGGAEVAGLYPGVLRRIGFKADEVLLDVGTGRGELLAVAVKAGARHAIGVEYSASGVAMARETLAVHDVLQRAAVVAADARALPLTSEIADIATMIDVVEHLAPAELDLTLRETLRVLRPGGRIAIHTFPTKTIYNVTYRLQRLMHSDWPKDPRNAFERSMHVNEQSVRTMRRALIRAGFRNVSVKLGQWIYTDFVPEEKAKRLYRLLARIPLLSPLGVADIWAEGVR